MLEEQTVRKILRPIDSLHNVKSYRKKDIKLNQIGQNKIELTKVNIKKFFFDSNIFTGAFGKYKDVIEN